MSRLVAAAVIACSFAAAPVFATPPSDGNTPAKTGHKGHKGHKHGGKKGHRHGHRHNGGTSGTTPTNA
jgi:hypothetical protein